MHALPILRSGSSSVLCTANCGSCRELAKAGARFPEFCEQRCFLCRQLRGGMPASRNCLLKCFAPAVAPVVHTDPAFPACQVITRQLCMALAAALRVLLLASPARPLFSCCSACGDKNIKNARCSFFSVAGSAPAVLRGAGGGRGSVPGTAAGLASPPAALPLRLSRVPTGPAWRPGAPNPRLAAPAARGCRPGVCRWLYPRCRC